MDNQNKKNQDPKKNNRQGFSFVILVTLITTILVLALYQFQGQGSETEISYDKFLKYVDAGKADKVEIDSDHHNEERIRRPDCEEVLYRSCQGRSAV